LKTHVEDAASHLSPLKAGVVVDGGLVLLFLLLLERLKSTAGGAGSVLIIGRRSIGENGGVNAEGEKGGDEEGPEEVKEHYDGAVGAEVAPVRTEVGP
jgi:hypothetical protein